ncbi:ATP-binding cassette domain-containing protein [Microbacterium sp. MEC084]|uniref:ABC transporter ATP-binding protein n=1 Tax=Microbacterium sp. MEC084 TaxID=1963027 RepID=UPI00106FA9DF|nr:ABC transporter ATP-binding protein [Microbacterium sp. MEC084]MCD1269362.1 ATP-binding cassette domain-containing protein [Microbacterium sp. MEC084]
MLEIANLIKSFPGEKPKGHKGAPPKVLAINDVNLQVERGEMFTLLGPSGCGKTTTLRSIAGLEAPDSGKITVGGRTFFHAGDGVSTVNVAANQRGLGMVFQSYAIWPHMTVFDNVAFPLQVMPRNTRPSKKEIKARVMRVLETLELAHYADRQATKLSGGQQQRLALGRGIIIEPELLLLDEPLSNLDAKLRESLRFELKRLQRELGITSIYVTHDQVEALSLSSNIAVMKNGAVQQVGKPRDIYERPRNHFVADFIGTSNFIEAKVIESSNGEYRLETAAGVLKVSSGASVPTGTKVVASIRPEAMDLSTQPIASENVWQGRVVARAFLGDAVDHVVAVGETEVRVRTAASVSLEQGTEVYVHLKAESISLVPAD